MQARGFDPTKDIRILQDFLAEMRNKVSQAAYFHFGDLLWRIYGPWNEFHDQTDIRIWENEAKEIGGFVFYSTPNNPEFFIRPELYGGQLEEEMLAWASERAKKEAAHTLETSCIAGEPYKTNFLRRWGFRQYGGVMVLLARSLLVRVPEVELPEDYSIIPMVDHCAFASVSGRSIAPEQYQNILKAPGYKPELDLRVCYQDTEIVSGCICWYDDIDQSGEFEPVGTDKDHRRKGLAVAVMSQAMTTLRKYGAEKAYVRTFKENESAVRLYQHMGFEIIHEDTGWLKDI